MRDLIEFLARALVDDPESVTVDSFEEDDGTVVYELRVAEDDVGKIIGRQGKVIRAVRSVVKAAATRQGIRVDVDVI